MQRLIEAVYHYIMPNPSIRFMLADDPGAGKRAGLSDEKIAAADDPNSDALDDKEKAVVRYSSELAKNVAASDEALNELKKYFDDTEIAEITMVAGVFHFSISLYPISQLELLKQS